MSQSYGVFKLTVRATTAITRGRGVTFAGAQATAAGQKIMGIAEFDAAIGDDVTVCVMGTARMEISVAIAIGDAIVVSANGRAQVATGVAIASGATAVTSAAANGVTTITGGELPQWVVGDALSGALIPGQFVEVLLRR